MKTTPELQRVVEAIAQKHDMNLEQVGCYLRLYLPGHGQLVIQNIGCSVPGDRISVTNYIRVGNDDVADPQVILYAGSSLMGHQHETWIPLEITELFGGWHLYAEIDEQGNFVLLDPAGQSELARTCEHIIARNLERDGWITEAHRNSACRPTEHVSNLSSQQKEEMN